MDLPVIQRATKIPVRAVSFRLNFRVTQIAVLCALLAPAVVDLFAGQTEQNPAEGGVEKPGQRPEFLGSAKWVPFVATFFHQSTPDWPGHVPERIVWGGPYLRNQEGSTYQRLRVVSKNSIPIQVRDVATLFDRPKGLIYRIDYADHTVEVERPKSDDLFHQVKDPITREEFRTDRASDRYLGMSTFEDFECELYKIRGKAKKGKYDAIVCYAPALNFLAVRAQSHTSKGAPIDMYFKDIQVGRKPGAEYFQIPGGFKIIDKTK